MAASLIRRRSSSYKSWDEEESNMKFKMIHENYNVSDLALGCVFCDTIAQRKNPRRPGIFSISNQYHLHLQLQKD